MAGEGFLPGVLPEVVSEIAALLEHRFAPADSALKVQFFSQCESVVDLHCLMPVHWHGFDCFWVV